MSHVRHFLDLDRMRADELRSVLDSAMRMKMTREADRLAPAKPLTGRTLAMVFDKPSTRTCEVWSLLVMAAAKTLKPATSTYERPLRSKANWRRSSWSLHDSGLWLRRVRLDQPVPTGSSSRCRPTRARRSGR